MTSVYITETSTVVEVSEDVIDVVSVGIQGPAGGGGGGGAVDSVNGQTGAVVLDQDDIGDGTTYKQYSATEKTKLAGIATGATANSSDAYLLARANHTGTQLAATISDFSTAASSAAPVQSVAGRTGAVVLTSSDVSLGNVTNVAQLPLSYLDTDVTLAANSDTKVASQKAVKAYAGTLVASAVIGPASATDNAIARFDTTTGKLIQNSTASIDDSGNITATNLSGTNTGDQTSVTGNAGTATTLATGRTIGITGDLTYTSPSFNGSANVTAAGTLATVNSNVGSYTNASITVNGKGLITAASSGAAPVTSVTGTANRIISSGGATPVIDISASYVGQSSITLIGTLGQALNMGSHQINNVTDPTSAQDAATKLYVDNAVLGQNYKEACKYATTAALPTVIYANGSSGVGATITGAAVGALSLDSATPSIGDRVLVKNQVSTFQNGIYTVTAVGSGAAVFIMTRATDFDQAADLKTGDATFITSGTTQSTTTWVYTGADSPVMGTDAIAFSQISGQGSFLAGTGISISGTTISINSGYVGQASITTVGTISTGVWNGTAIANSYLANSAVTVNGTSISLGASGTVTAAAGTLTGTTLNSAVVTSSLTSVGTLASGAIPASLVTPGTFGSGAYSFGTGNAVTVGTIELGAASDTTIARSGAGAITVEGVQVILSGAALGTPASGTLTNCTGLPVAGITASTSTALGVGSIELGAATDTTLSRSAAGVLAVEGVVIPSISSTSTLTNKRITPRVVTTTQSATPTINTDNGDIFSITALAQAITSFTTNLSGAPNHGEMICIEITDNGTARALTWGTSFVASTVPLPTTTVISTPLRALFEWDAISLSKWVCMAVA